MSRAQRQIDETASPKKQKRLKRAHRSGAVIEVKGRDTVHCEYRWAVAENPRWDFRNNYYRRAKKKRKG